MKRRDLSFRCLAKEESPGVWVAMNLDFDLAVQGESLVEVKRKLAEQTASYLYDAMLGDDRDHFDYLVGRRAPLYMFAQWHFYRLASRVDHAIRNVLASFEPMPMMPSIARAA